jgi:hypothetical protein
MTYLISSMIVLSILTLYFYKLRKFRKVVAAHNEKLERLQGMVDRRETESRLLLQAYLSESEASKFYSDAASIAKDRDVIRLFSKLARDERKHVALLERCLSEKELQ